MNDSIKLQLKKTIKAKRDKVFEAWTNPELMMKWYAPGSMVVPSASADPKVGGTYQVEMKGRMEGEEVNPTVRGTYRKIIPNEMICFTFAWEGDPAPETLVTVVLKDVEGGTEVTLTHEKFQSKEAKDSHEHGWTGCLENLAKLFG